MPAKNDIFASASITTTPSLYFLKTIFTIAILFFVASAAAENKNHHHIDNNANTISFAVIGDGPYGDNREVAFSQMIEDINSDHEVDFVIHVGDNKAPRRKQRGINGALQSIGFQPTFAPRGGEYNPKRLKMAVLNVPTIVCNVVLNNYKKSKWL